MSEGRSICFYLCVRGGCEWPSQQNRCHWPGSSLEAEAAVSVVDCIGKFVLSVWRIVWAPHPKCFCALLESGCIEHCATAAGVQRWTRENRVGQCPLLQNIVLHFTALHYKVTLN